MKEEKLQVNKCHLNLPGICTESESRVHVLDSDPRLLRVIETSVAALETTSLTVVLRSTLTATAFWKETDGTGDSGEETNLSKDNCIFTVQDDFPRSRGFDASNS